ncbi:hypothetical protein IFM89_002732 [Coptis chinensis]|uniref:glutathione transferase n=1 Tax=Coptis chinensis TaxID=261450 RepID=A0A835M9L2_9MAGN|nr:hypothetical protein IFM89_002732 [Coptis chinensis]
MKLVVLTNKPEWFLEITPEGEVHIAELDENWIVDSDVITKLLEEKYPGPSLEVPPEKGIKDLSTFIGFVKRKGP